MKVENNNNVKKIPVIEMLRQQYKEAENRKEIDYWKPLTDLITESLKIRYKKGFSQKDIAQLMKTRQSVISRFENLGRTPSYDFLSRLALALDQKLGLTLYGDYMAIVPENKQSLIEREAKKRNISSREYTQVLLEDSIEAVIFSNRANEENATSVFSVDDESLIRRDKPLDLWELNASITTIKERKPELAPTA